MKKINILFVTVLTMTLAASCSKNQKLAIKKHPVTLRLSENHVSGYPTSLADEEFAQLPELSE